jgi:hypothetical protein
MKTSTRGCRDKPDGKPTDKGRCRLARMLSNANRPYGGNQVNGTMKKKTLEKMVACCGNHAKSGALMLLALAFFTMLAATACAHSPLMMIEDNEDGTITVTAGYSTGQMAAGKKVLLKAGRTGKVLWEGTLNEDGELACPKQTEPYTVFFDGGPGHSMEKDGIVLKAGEKAPAPASASPAHAEKAKAGPDTVTDATRIAKKNAAKGDDAPVYPQWRLPLSSDFTDDINEMLHSEAISVRNALGLVRTTSLLQCYQYHGQAKLASWIAMVKNKRKAGKKVEAHVRPVSMCMGITSGYLAADFAMRELYGNEMPVMEDFRIGSKAKMGGVWDALELVLGRRLSREHAVSGPSPDAFVFTAERLSDGRRIVFTYSDDFKKRLARFFEGMKNSDKISESEFQRIRTAVLRELITRHAHKDYGYFVILKAS